jgi:gliding motility-associated lipoprotein GldH
MRILIALSLAAILLAACDDTRVYEQISDFENRQWISADKPQFEFIIDDINQRYNLYSDIRNSVSYPYSRFFFTYYLRDSTGSNVQKSLITEYLFDAKTGKPYGKSGIGDLYDHRFLLLENYQFQYPGKYQVIFEQFMRMDTLPGIMSVGLRVERAEKTGATP